MPRCLLDKMRSSHEDVVDALSKGKIDDQITQTIEAVMADIAGQYKK